MKHISPVLGFKSYLWVSKFLILLFASIFLILLLMSMILFTNYFQLSGLVLCHQWQTECLPLNYAYVSLVICHSVTVVSRFDVFWVKAPGPIIYQYEFTPFPTQPQTKLTPTTPSILAEPVSLWTFRADYIWTFSFNKPEHGLSVLYRHHHPPAGYISGMWSK